ncbi:MAG: DNA-binding response regulator, partial [Paraprevotella sp.]|nr:DNA-binding response regulator [Paraprevotella sp.]
MTQETHIEHKSDRLPAPSDADIPEVCHPDTECPFLLFVHANEEWCATIKAVLSATYRLLTAGNGQEAQMQFTEHSIDLIIFRTLPSPTDGLSFCRQIKSQPTTASVPIIILSDKDDANVRTAYYEADADSYLVRPLEMKVLTARIDSLIRINQKRRQPYATKFPSDGDSAPDCTHFIRRVTDIIHTHLDKERFGLETLSSYMHISPSTLHRKVKAQTGLTPLDFIRKVKMKYACIMLSHREQTISEIAYATGFSTPKYFT